MREICDRACVIICQCMCSPMAVSALRFSHVLEDPAVGWGMRSMLERSGSAEPTALLLTPPHPLDLSIRPPLCLLNSQLWSSPQTQRITKNTTLKCSLSSHWSPPSLSTIQGHTPCHPTPQTTVSSETLGHECGSQVDSQNTLIITYWINNMHLDWCTAVISEQGPG